MRRLLYVLPAVLVAALAFTFAIGLRDRDPSALPSALIDRPLPALDLPAVEGVDLPGWQTADLHGEVMLVNVFASWCPPCRVEHPVLTRLTEVHGVPLIGVNYKDAPEAAAAFLVELGNPYRKIGGDFEGRAGLELGISGVPETFIVDADGHIRFRHAGPVLPEHVEQVFLPLLRELRG
ncbi:MAG: DsbE family thiol:disulfide interchange protein [Geminicoccaceae bacterium]|nr:MAG: DsbE family thiol:disulfide interchange protein [Geminicoccaceae bacterium]